MAVLTDGLFVVRVGQHLLAQGAALHERLLVHLFPDVANQDLEEGGRGGVGRATHGVRTGSKGKCKQSTCVTLAGEGLKVMHRE